jgi:hypothetical protein
VRAGPLGSTKVEDTNFARPSKPESTPAARVTPAVNATSHPQRGMAFRVMAGGREIGREIALPATRAIIGRAEFGDIILPGAKVSRSHAAVFVRGDEYWIEDLNSQNGVLVNGDAIDEARQLAAGDRVRIGEYELQFVAASPAAPVSDAVLS